jgi:hypothetical protein
MWLLRNKAHFENLSLTYSAHLNRFSSTVDFATVEYGTASIASYGGREIADADAPAFTI